MKKLENKLRWHEHSSNMEARLAAVAPRVAAVCCLGDARVVERHVEHVVKERHGSVQHANSPPTPPAARRARVIARQLCHPATPPCHMLDKVVRGCPAPTP